MAGQANTPPNSAFTERRIRVVMALACAALSVLAGHLALLRVGGSVSTMSYDIPFLLGHRPGGTEDLRIVYLDELDGDFVDRRSQAALLDKLNEAGARAVVYDLIFDLPSDDPAVDREFAAAIRRFRGVDENDEPVSGALRRPVLLACGRQTLQQTGVSGEQLIPPTDELLAAADDFGLVALVHDKKFTVREISTGTFDEPSLTWKAAVALGAPLDEEQRLLPRWLNYAGPPPDPARADAVAAIPSCGATDIMNGAVPGFLRDKVVVVGAKPGMVGAAAGLDLFSTPFHRFDLRGDLPLTSGVEIQATTLANLLRGNWLVRSAPRHDNLLVWMAGILAGLLFARLKPAHGFIAAAVCAVMLALLGTLIVHHHRLWFPWSVTAFVQIPIALVAGTAAHFYIERFFRVKLGEEQRQIREAFAKYLSPQMLERLTSERFQMKVGGEKIEAAMMFTDLENFTDMCERVGDPERIVATLNDYFERTTCHIFDHDGVVVKFIGDAIFAAWGAPIHEPDAALKAAHAAWKLCQSDQLVVDGVPIRTRIGVHIGDVVAGNVGSTRRVDYTLIGDAVNLAARLESLNKTLGTHILISDEVNQRLGGEYRTRMVGRFRVKGRRELTVIHELLGPTDRTPEPEWINHYRQAQAALAAGDLKLARQWFNATEESLGRQDGPSQFFLFRLNTGEPMPNGIVEMTEK
jgi:class 3 adenylate cyclase/CHASE2 domain-containing sensor protein